MRTDAPKFKHHPPHLRFRALELLASGLSLKEVEKRTGVNRGTLSKVKRGIYRWPMGDETKNVLFDPKSKARCRNCGALVFLPCIACELRK